MVDSTTSDSLSILEDGKLKPGIYKIQNLYTRTYMDIHDHLREVCCRPATALKDGVESASADETNTSLNVLTE